MTALKWLFRLSMFFLGAAVGCWATTLLLLALPGPEPEFALLLFAGVHSVVALLFTGLWFRQHRAARRLDDRGLVALR